MRDTGDGVATNSFCALLFVSLHTLPVTAVSLTVACSCECPSLVPSLCNAGGALIEDTTCLCCSPNISGCEGLTADPKSLAASEGSETSAAAIVGGVIGGLAAALAVLIVVLYRRRRALVHRATQQYTALLAARVLPEAEREFFNQFAYGMTDEEGHRISFGRLLVRRAELQVLREIGQGHYGSVFVVKRRLPGHIFPTYAGKEAKVVVEGEEFATVHRRLLIEAHILHELRHPNVRRSCPLLFLLSFLFGLSRAHHGRGRGGNGQMIPFSQNPTGLPSPQIVSLEGLSVDRVPMLLLFEYMAGGDLRTHLRGLRQRHSSITPELYASLYGVAVQVAGAMEYLESRFVVHRDLAARNVLVGDSLAVVKLADFGLTRGVGQDETYIMKSQMQLPIKWMAPESIRDSVFTSRRDVWFYGVIVW